MINNIIKGIQYKDTGFKPSNAQNQFRNQCISFLEEKIGNNSIILNNAPNRIGKTITTLKHLENQDLKVLYLSDRHPQISEVEKKLNSPKFVHWRGLKDLCHRYNDPLIYTFIKSRVPVGSICYKCEFVEECKYWPQWRIDEYVIVGAPKELLPFKYVQEEEWDVIVFDEIIDKGRLIEPYYPQLSKNIFDYFKLNEFYLENYKMIDSFIKLESFEENAINITRDDAFKARKHIIPKITQWLKKDNEILENPEVYKLLKYLSHLYETVEWMQYCAKYGYKTHYYRPYVYDLLDLKEKYSSDIFILNTSLNKEFYNNIIGNYRTSKQKIQEFPFEVINKNSFLLHYNFMNRSCAKNAIFETNKKGKILIDETGFPTLNNEKYGKEVINLAMTAIEVGVTNDLKTGLITYNDAKPLFEGLVDVVSHFGGHQGSNAFDDVDILIILGKYTINPQGLYQKYFMLTNELLKDNNAEWKTYKYINGSRIRFSDNKQLNQIMLYKLNEEQGQAIYRSGAHVNDGKIVISFGFVPEGVPNILKYSNFSTSRGLKISLSKRLKKIQST